MCKWLDGSSILQTFFQLSFLFQGCVVKTQASAENTFTFVICTRKKCFQLSSPAYCKIIISIAQGPVLMALGVYSQNLFRLIFLEIEFFYEIIIHKTFFRRTVFNIFSEILKETLLQNSYLTIKNFHKNICRQVL